MVDDVNVTLRLNRAGEPSSLPSTSSSIIVIVSLIKVKSKKSIVDNSLLLIHLLHRPTTEDTMNRGKFERIYPLEWVCWCSLFHRFDTESNTLLLHQKIHAGATLKRVSTPRRLADAAMKPPSHYARARKMRESLANAVQ